MASLAATDSSLPAPRDWAATAEKTPKRTTTTTSLITTALSTVRLIEPLAPVSLITAMVAAGEVAKEIAATVRPTHQTAGRRSPRPGRAIAGMTPLTA